MWMKAAMLGVCVRGGGVCGCVGMCVCMDVCVCVHGLRRLCVLSRGVPVVCSHRPATETFKEYWVVAFYMHLCYYTVQPEIFTTCSHWQKFYLQILHSRYGDLYCIGENFTP